MSSITFSGLGSTLDYASWIEDLVAIKQEEIDAVTAKKTAVSTTQSTLSTVKSAYSGLLTSIQKITDASYGSTTDLFAQKTTSSADSGIVTATATALASTQSLNISVSQLATSTVAKSANSVATSMTGSTSFEALSNGEAKTGTLSIYVNNTKYGIDIESGDTVDNILTKINGLKDVNDVSLGLNATITNGKITIASGDSSKIVVGSSSDTSNFANIMSLTRSADGLSYSSSKSILASNTSVALTGGSAGFTSAIMADSSFKIGDATFTIDSNTTLDGLISQINSSSDAGVSAYWDSTEGKLVLTADEEGATNIDIEDVTGNFLQSMGLTTNTYEVDGKTVKTSSLNADTQTLGKNAILEINGNEITSSSNTVTSDISGIKGLTLNLNSVSSVDSETGLAETTAVKVTSDNSSLTSALSSFVTAYNKVLSYTKTVTSIDGDLHGEATLNLIKNNIRGLAGQLSSLGITTGKIGSALTDDTDKVTLDADVLAKALKTNSEAVKKTLLGDETTDGVLDKLTKILDNSLSSTDGYFASKSSTLTDKISAYDKKITKMTASMGSYEKSLKNQFDSMDTMISTYKAQYNTFCSILGLTNSLTSSES